LRLGSRGSKLALAQAKLVLDSLAEKKPGSKIEVVIVQTQGDKDHASPLTASAGIGLFTKELEEALRRNEIDAAVHSLKDLPTRLASGMALAAVSEREDWRDAWLCPNGYAFKELPRGAKVGTGSPRRRAQLRRLRPDLEFVEFRGNIDTRLRKLKENQVQGAVLAAAGLKRIGMSGEATSLFGEAEMLPAPGQGFLAIECRSEDAESEGIFSSFDVVQARACAFAERAFLDRLGAGCHAPVAALARVEGSSMRLKGFVMNQDGTTFEGTMDGELDPKGRLGLKLAEKLIAEGAELTD
jgi:hydroxymethylbilane synthase